MVRKTVDHPRKTVESGVEATQSGPMARPCYKSFRQNGDVFRRNSQPDKDLELLSYVVEFKLKPTKELRPKTTVVHPAECVQHLTRMELTSPTQLFDRRRRQTKSNNRGSHRKEFARPFRQQHCRQFLADGQRSIRETGVTGHHSPLAVRRQHRSAKLQDAIGDTREGADWHQAPAAKSEQHRPLCGYARKGL